MLLQADQVWLAEEQIGDVTVVTVKQPELLDEAVIQSISAQLYRLAEQQYCRRLVLNLATVERLSSRMLGTFVALHKTLHRAGGKFILCGVDHRLMEVFTLFRLAQSLRICREEQEALQAF